MEKIYEENLKKLVQNLKPFIDTLNEDEIEEITNRTLLYGIASNQTYCDIVNQLIKYLRLFINGLDDEEIGEYCVKSINDVTEYMNNECPMNQ